VILVEIPKVVQSNFPWFHSNKVWEYSNGHWDGVVRDNSYPKLTALTSTLDRVFSDFGDGNPIEVESISIGLTAQAINSLQTILGLIPSHLTSDVSQETLDQRYKSSVLPSI